MAKLTIEFNDKMTEILEEMSRKERLPKTHVIRRAIALFKFVEGEREKGHKLAITDQNDRVLKEIVG